MISVFAPYKFGLPLSLLLWYRPNLALCIHSTDFYELFSNADDGTKRELQKALTKKLATGQAISASVQLERLVQRRKPFKERSKEIDV